jgi:signal transduction histidine kinase
LLKLKSIAGLSAEALQMAKECHFNWRKAGMKAQDEHDLPSQTIPWTSVTIRESKQIERGIKGQCNIFENCAAMIPVKLAGGPFGLLIIGQQRDSIRLGDQEEFVLTACRDLATRILTLQLSLLLKNERIDWERAAKLTGHRLRAFIQDINSQLKSIKAYYENELGFTRDEKVEAEKDLEHAFNDLIDISCAAESSIPGVLYLKTARREWLSLGDIIESAVDAQQDLADEIGVAIVVPKEIKALPQVFGNSTFLKFAFVNLINNGLKYSYPRPGGKKRELRIHPSKKWKTDLVETGVEIVNFGLGIKMEDRESIFEWGTRLSPATLPFREVFGRGIGLWEVKRIIEGHGGKVFVESIHHTKVDVTDENIDMCITIFTVVLPTGKP